MSDKQVSLNAALRTLMSSAGYLAIAAAVCLMLAAILPVVTLSTSLNGAELPGLRSVAGGSISPSGASAGGALGWFAVLAFIAAAASRFLREMAPFKRRIDIAAFVILALAVVWSASDGPLAVQIRTAGEVSHMFDGLGGGGGAPGAKFAISVSVLPSIGSLFVLLAPIALVLARRRETIVAASPVGLP